MKTMRIMKGTKSMKKPLLPRLIPMCTIFCFSLFVIWRFCSRPTYGPLHSVDQSDTLSAIAQTKSLYDANGDSLGEANQPLRIHDLPVEEEDNDCCRCAAEDTRESREKRASVLLHNWTDEELFARAIAEEERDKPSITFDCSTKLHQFRSDSALSCSSFCKKRGKGPVKIAFLFMITTALPFEALWNKFFEGKEGMYNIYVHADPFRHDLFNESSGVFRGRLIPSRKAARGSPSLVLASNRLVANAMMDDPLNEYFALLSDHCIPIRKFDHVYNVITSSQQSFVEQIRNESIMYERYTGLEGGEEIMLPEIPFDLFRKAAQWFVFIRRHAYMILRDVLDRKYWSKFDRKCMIYFCGTDEHYYPTVLNILDPGGANGKTVTYVQWPEWITEHPWMFENYEVNTTLIRYIQGKDDGQYLFARKFHEETVDLLMTMTDTILS